MEILDKHEWIHAKEQLRTTSRLTIRTLWVRWKTFYTTRVGTRKPEHVKYAVTGLEPVRKTKGGSNRVYVRGSARRNMHVVEKEWQSCAAAIMKSYFYYTRGNSKAWNLSNMLLTVKGLESVKEGSSGSNQVNARGSTQKKHTLYRGSKTKDLFASTMLKAGYFY